MSRSVFSSLVSTLVTYPTLGAAVKVCVTKPATVSLHSSKYNHVSKNIGSVYIQVRLSYENITLPS